MSDAPETHENSKLRFRIFADARQLREMQDLLTGGPAIETVLEVANSNDAAPSRLGSEPPRYLQRVPIYLPQGEILFLDTEHINWIEASNQYVRLHTRKGQYLLRESMKHLASLLAPDRFVRIHRSSMINLGRVEKLRADSSVLRWAILEDGHSLKVSQRYWGELQQALTWRPGRWTR